MALTKFNSIGGYSVGADANTVIDANGNITATTLEVTTSANLGAVGNVIITGGTSGQFLQTDGSGSLAWANAGGGGGGNIISQPAIQFTATSNANNQTFSNANLVSFMSNAYGMVFKNGVLVDVGDYVISGTTLTLNVYAQDGDSVTVAPVTGPTPAPAGVNTQIQFNDGGAFGASSGLKFTKSSNTLAVGGPIRLSDSAGNYVELKANGVTSNTSYSLPKADGSNGQVLTTAGNGVLSWANSGTGGANVAGSNTQVQFNDGGTLGASANFTFNKSTNTLSATNISGNGTGLTAIAGANVTGTVANANYSAFSGVATTAAQPNITSLGTLTALNVSGTSNLSAIGNVKITGGSSGQVIATDGTGNLSFTTISGSAISNGNSNVNIAAANGNVTLTAGGNTTMTVTSTGANVAGYTNVTGNLTVGSISNLGAVGNVRITGGTSGQVLTTNGNGNLSWSTVSGGSGSSISNGNSNLAIYDSNLQLKLGNISNVLYAEAYQFGANWYTSTVTANGNIAITSTTTGPNSYGGFLTVDKGITAQYITSNTSISAATYLGVFASSSNAQPNITSVGTLLALGVTGDILVYTGNITTNSGNITSGNAINAKGFYGYGQGIIDFKVSNSGMSVSNGGGNTAEVRLQAVDGANGGEAVVISKTAVTTALNFTLTGSNISLGNINSVKITGGITGQVLTTDGNGNLSFTNSISSISSLSNGTSNITLASNGNITMSVANTANVINISDTAVNVNATLTVSGAATFNGGLQGILYSGNSNVRIWSPNGVVAISATGTANVLKANASTVSVLNLESQGLSNLNSVSNVTITGGSNGQVLTTNGSGGLSWTTITSGSTDSISNGNSNVSVAANGNVTISSAGNANIVTVTGTGANIAGTLNATGNVVFTGANIHLGGNGNIKITGGSSGQILSTDGTGNLSWTTSGSGGNSISSGNSNVAFAAANGNINLTSAGNISLVVTGTGANITGTANITGVANVGGNLNVAGNAAFTGANVSLGDVANVHISGGANGYVMSTDGSGNVSFIQSGYSVAQYLSVGRSSNQTIASGNWSSRDVIFNQVNQQLNIPYDTSTGLANLTANVTYRITAALAWQANTSYFYPFAIYDSNNNQVSQLFEAFPPAFNGNNSTSGVVDFIYTPTVNTRIKTRTFTGITASTGEWIRGAGPTGIATYMTIQAVAAPFVSSGATGMDYVQVKNSSDFSVSANANIVFNTVTGNLGTTLYDTATGNFTLKANTTYRLISGQSSNSSGGWWPFAWKWASNGNHVATISGFASANTFPGATPLEVIVTVGVSDANVQLRVDGNNSGTLRANSGWAIAQAIGGQATTTNLNLLGNLTIGGTTWQPGTWTVDTAWTFGGTTTAPTMATAHNKRLAWKVEGKTMTIKGFYTATSSTGATAGSGEYVLTLPGGYQINTTVTGTAAVGAITSLPVGQLTIDTSNQFRGTGQVITYDSTRVKFIAWYVADGGGVGSTGITPISSTFYNLNTASRYNIFFTAEIPIL
jgi:hypothetical protein